MRGGLKELYLAKKYAVSDPAERAAAAAALHPVSHGSGICLVVIGESANRNHWHCCGYDRETTPWADTDPHAVVFSQAYSCFTHTEPAVTMALSQFSNYDPSLLLQSSEDDNSAVFMRIMKSFSLLEILSGAGVKTYWFSNQEKIGAYNNLISALSRSALKQEFLEDFPPYNVKNGRI